MDTKNKDIKVLIVDDNAIVREVIALVVKRKGYISEDANNGKEALEKISQRKPDIIILDVAMPEMNGIEVCTRLREDTHTQGIPIIFLSAQRGVEEFMKGMPGAVIEYIEKPCNIEHLLRLIEKIVSAKDPAE